MSVVRHHLGLQANTMATTSLQLTQRAVEDLVELEAMGVAYGPAGCGKTFAWQTAVQALDVPVCAVQFPSHPTPLRVAQVLMAKLTGQRTPKASRFALSDDLVDLLCEQPRLVVIDEAQWLNRDCIEYVRHLHDEPDTRFGLLLVGGEGCWQVLSREAMLRSRLYHRVVFKPMTAEAVLRVVPQFHPLYEDAPLDLIAFIDERVAHGYFRAWATFTHAAERICRQRGQGLNEPIARAVIALHDSDADAA